MMQTSEIRLVPRRRMIVTFVFMLVSYFCVINARKEKLKHKKFDAVGTSSADDATADDYLRQFVARPNGDHDFVYSERPSAVAFWHIYASGPAEHPFLPAAPYLTITKEQKFVMESSGLMDALDIVYYTTMGSNGSSFRIPGRKMQHLHYGGERGFEIPTLNLLYRFCSKNPNSRVLYFHNKGGGNFYPTDSRASFLGGYNRKRNFRRLLDCFNLNPRCLRVLQLEPDTFNFNFDFNYDVCGMRFTAIPAIHFSGNYWWARCRYVNTLLPPKAAMNNDTFLRVNSELNAGRKRNESDFSFHNNHLLGFGRYFAETWIGSAPVLRCADCMRHKDSADYVFGSGVPKELRQQRICRSWADDFDSIVSRYDIENNTMRSGNNNNNSSASGRSRSSRGVASSSGSRTAAAAGEPVPRFSFGLPCGESEMFSQPQKFRSSRAADSWVRKYAPLAPQLMQRTLLWYGQRPETYLHWLRAYFGNETIITSVRHGNKSIDHILSDRSIDQKVQRIIRKHQLPQRQQS